MKSRKEASRRYYLKHKKEILERVKKWSENNKDKRDQYNKSYVEKYPERIKKTRKKHYLKNKEKLIKKAIAWAKENRGLINGRRRTWNKCNKEEASLRLRQYRYGIPKEEFNNIVQQQEGSCAVCFKKLTTMHLDHDHVTNKYRGILCFNCNTGLGMFKDSQDNLRSAIQYLDKYKEQ